MVRKIFFLAATTALVSANAQSFEIDGHEAVDLGLSVLWATCNVGADSPEKPGDYFAWGETEPKKDFFEKNYLFTERPNELDADHDAATQQWGKNWRMPTNTEITKLKQLKRRYENNGYYIEGNNGNSIFVPATGYYQKNELIKGERFFCWSKNKLDKDYSYMFSIEGNKLRNYCGATIRPVCEKSDASKLNYVEKENVNTVYKTIENGQIVIIKNGVKYNLRGQKL